MKRRVRGFFITWWRIRKNMVRDFETMRPSPWWSPKAIRSTFHVWSRFGYGKHFEA